VDAKWLVSLFPVDRPIPTSSETHEVFLAQGEDMRALFFAGHIGAIDEELVQRSAEMGYAPAQAKMTESTDAEKGFAWAEKAAAQGDRAGLNMLGWGLSLGIGCSADSNEGLLFYKEAAEPGDANAQYSYGRYMFDEKCWERYY
jgi:hypothetical protein